MDSAGLRRLRDQGHEVQYAAGPVTCSVCGHRFDDANSPATCATTRRIQEQAHARGVAEGRAAERLAVAEEIVHRLRHWETDIAQGRTSLAELAEQIRMEARIPLGLVDSDEERVRIRALVPR